MSLHELHAISQMAVVAAGGGGNPLYVDIITIVACFFLVYWILSKYAFGPILAAMDARRDQVESDLKKAETFREEAAEDQKKLAERLALIEDEARTKVQEAVNEGKVIAEELRQKAQEQADAMIEKARQNVEFEMQKAREELKQDIIRLTIAATEKLIHERLDDDKHRDLIGDFVNRLEKN